MTPIVFTSWDQNNIQPEQPQPQSQSTVWWFIAAVAVVVIAAVLRFYKLDLVPLHHDEGVNGFFLTNLVREHNYKYNPENYHGPTLYYIAWVFVSVLGLKTWVIRSVTAVFGVGIVTLLLGLRKDLGKVGSLVAALFMAISPGAVYLSRYFIHETLFVFFTLAIVAGFLSYYRRGRSVGLIVAFTSAAFLIATKETAVITLGVFLIAIFLATVLVWLRSNLTTDASGGFPENNPIPDNFSEPVVLRTTLQDDPVNRRSLLPIILWAIAIILAAIIIVTLYSSFFTNDRGILDCIRAFKFWVKTGEHEHTHPWYSYILWLITTEPVVVFLGVCGIVLTALRHKDRFNLFVAFWGIGIIAAYSILHYKTPWLTLNFILPLAMLSGIALEFFTGFLGMAAYPGAVVLVLIGAVISGYTSIKLNFFHYDDERYAYVYAHTQREFLLLVNEIDRIARESGKGNKISIAVTSTVYWPLPWYLRDYTAAGYYGKVTATDSDLIVASTDQESELRPLLGDNYVKLGPYRMRPGVDLLLYARKDLPR